MKKLIILALVASFSTAAMAQSEVKKSIVVNQSNNTLTNTQAYGIGNTAGTGSVLLKNSKVKKSILVNKSNNTLTKI